MKRFKCVLQSISKVEEYVSMLTTIVLVFVLLMQVVYRKILNNPLAWTEEFARILFIYVTLIGTSILYRKGEHISFDYVADKLIKGKAEVIRKIAVNIVMAIYLIAILQPSFKYIARMNTVPLKFNCQHTLLLEYCPYEYGSAGRNPTTYGYFVYFCARCGNPYSHPTRRRISPDSR